MPKPRGDWWTGYHTMAGQGVDNGTWYPDPAMTGGAALPGVQPPIFASTTKAGSLFEDRDKHAIIRTIFMQSNSGGKLAIQGYDSPNYGYWSMNLAKENGNSIFWSGSLFIETGFRIVLTGTVLTFSLQYQEYSE